MIVSYYTKFKSWMNSTVLSQYSISCHLLECLQIWTWMKILIMKISDIVHVVIYKYVVFCISSNRWLHYSAIVLSLKYFWWAGCKRLNSESHILWIWGILSLIHILRSFRNAIKNYNELPFLFLFNTSMKWAFYI